MVIYLQCFLRSSSFGQCGMSYGQKQTFFFNVLSIYLRINLIQVERDFIQTISYMRSLKKFLPVCMFTFQGCKKTPLASCQRISWYGYCRFSTFLELLALIFPSWIVHSSSFIYSLVDNEVRLNLQLVIFIPIVGVTYNIPVVSCHV